MYIYECQLSNDKTIIKKNLNDLCECINQEIMENDWNNMKLCNAKCIYNYFNRNKKANYMKSLKRTEIKDYFKNDLVNQFGEDYINNNSCQSVNRRLRMIYDNMNKKYEDYENMCEAEDNMDMWNGE